MYRIEKYNSSYHTQWNSFIEGSKNGTFLFNRDFMEYHSDRFEDFSLLIFENETLKAVLPANIAGGEVHSHQGLTYGGLIYNGKLRQASVIKIYSKLLEYLNTHNIAKLHVKPVPAFYHLIPAQEQEYALFLANSKLVRRDSLSVIENPARIKIAANRLEGVKKAAAHNLVIAEADDFTDFWTLVLEPNLRARHGVKPVHTLDEMQKLKILFPDNIKHYIVLHHGDIVAGAVLFETVSVAHVQYISATESKNELGSLDFLFHYLITDVYLDKKYFDFGISNEQHGRKLNEGLIFWKESFGARTIVHDFYEIDTANYHLLENVTL